MFCIDFNQFWAKKALISDQVLNILPQNSSDPNIFPPPPGLQRRELYTPLVEPEPLAQEDVPHPGHDVYLALTPSLIVLSDAESTWFTFQGCYFTRQIARRTLEAKEL